MKGKHLVLVGGGHAHLLTIATLDAFTSRGHAVTIIQPQEHHYYSGMGPGMLAGTYRPEEIRFPTRTMVEKRGGTFLQAKVILINPDRRHLALDTGQTVPFDVLSCNTGSEVIDHLGSPDGHTVFAVKPIDQLLLVRNRILGLSAKSKVRIGVVGGGPTGIEIAGNAWRLARTVGSGHQPSVHLFTGKELLPGAPPGVKRRVAASLRRRNITLITGCRVILATQEAITLDNGQIWPVDLTVAATGVRPSRLFTDSGLPTGPDGGLAVNRYLQSLAQPMIFGGGDCIHFADHPLDKVGVYAVRQNPILAHNLLATLEGAPLRPFLPQTRYLRILNMGDGTGVAQYGAFILGGRLAFLIKDRIDRRFMRSYGVTGHTPG